MSAAVRKGGCLCGGVRYRVEGPMRGVIACHCSQCRRSSGHHVAASAAMRETLVLETSETLVWYRSSPGARRGFCGTCGGNLFWDADGAGHVSVMAGTLDAPTGLETIAHIHAATAADYHDLPADIPRFDGDPPEDWRPRWF